MMKLDWFKKSGLDEPLWRIHFSWAGVLAFVAFWCYGYFAALTTPKLSVIANFGVSVVLYLIFVFFLIAWHKCDAYFRDCFIVTRGDFCVFLSYLVIMFMLSLPELNLFLQGDQIHHAKISQWHATQIVFKVAHWKAFLRPYIFSSLARCIDACFLFSVVLIYFVVRRKAFWAKFIVFSLIFILLRWIIFKNGGYPDIHPPFRLFPLWLSSSIFSLNSFSFRLPQFLVLVIFMAVSEKLLRRDLPSGLSWLFVLTIATIPVVWHAGVLAEQSVWTALIWTVFLLVVYQTRDMSRFHWARWVSVISIVTLIRQTAFIALVPVFLLFISELIYKKRLDMKRCFFLFSPVLVMLPFLLKCVIFGTPATYISGEVDFMPEGASMLQRAWIALSSGMAFKIALVSMKPVWLIFLPFAFCPSRFKKDEWKKRFITFLFFAAAFLIFFSIRPVLWGNGRYQAEYLVPFIVLGLYTFLSFFKVRKIIFLKAVVVCLLCLLSFNIFVFKNLYSWNDRGVLSQTPYAFGQALKMAQKQGYADHLFLAGVTYGIFPQIMCGFTVEQVVAAQEIYDEINQGFDIINYPALKKDRRVRMVFVGDIKDFKWASGAQLMLFLETTGWKRWKNLYNNVSHTTIEGYVRYEEM